MSTILGKPITMGGGGKLPDIFGDGSDGDLMIKAGETVTLPVPVPHQSVIEKNYTSITIEAGGTLTTADYNAGLVLRCQGDCNISGTIDQSGKAPKTNPSTTYPYPAELQCGDGGAGGTGGAAGAAGSPGVGGTPMVGRPYGGGYGSGGGGGAGRSNGGNGGSTDSITVLTPDNEMFIGGATGERGQPGNPGENGGGGGGSWGDSKDAGGYARGGAGGSGAGGSGSLPDANFVSGGGGGAGNYGGGVVLLYVGGNLAVDGTIDCRGLTGGNGAAQASSRNYGSGGGGGGGGAIYIVHNGSQAIVGALNVNGGAAGANGSGEAGGVGTTTVKKYERGMTA